MLKLDGPSEYMSIGRDHLGDPSLLVQGQQDDACGRHANPHLAFHLAMEPLFPEIVGDVRLLRIEPEALEGQDVFGGLGLADGEEPDHGPLPEGPPDLEKCYRPL